MTSQPTQAARVSEQACLVLDLVMCHGVDADHLIPAIDWRIQLPPH